MGEISVPQYSGSSRLVCPKAVVVVAIAAAAVVVVVVVVVVIVVVVAAAAVVAVAEAVVVNYSFFQACLLYTSPSPRDSGISRMPSSA